MANDLEVVIVHHRTPTLLLRSLTLLARYAPQCAVTVVDTALDASLPRQLEGVHPRLTWRSTRNHSYADAINVGLKATRAPLVATMNADVWIGPQTLVDLVAPFDDDRVAFTGPVARDAEGRVQDQGPEYRWHLARLRWRTPGGLAHAAGAPTWIQVPWLSGCLLVVRRSALRRIGGMDGTLRFYNEDLEWGLRARAAGLRCALVHSEVTHLGGSATPPDGRFLVEALRGGYAISRRARTPAARFAHRWGLVAVAWAQAQLQRDPERRATWRDVVRRFLEGDLDASPFGDELGPATAAPSRDLSEPPPDRAPR